MAASDKHYRDQYGLDFVFAVSNLLMLVSVVWMFWEDHYREYKPEQRGFRDVESAMAQRMALEQIPSAEEFAAAESKVKEAKEERDSQASQLADYRSEISKLLPKKESSEVAYQNVKANLESKISLYNIEVDKHGKDTAHAKAYLRTIDELNKDLDKAQKERDKHVTELQDYQRKVDGIEGDLTKALSQLKKVGDRFDTQIKLAMQKDWGWGDWFRALPVIDGFASPIKIHQFTINDIPIDYNFKYVTRFDRCMTCHLGIDRPTYTKENLRNLTKVTDDQVLKLNEAWALLNKRKRAVAGLDDVGNLPTKSDLTLKTVSPSFLTEGRVNEFCAHPRLDLFVGANSKHAAERFGCSACHAGQGSGTGFLLASHTPNDADTKKQWIDKYGWFFEAHKGNSLWDFPMLPMRFIESSCLKCHHQVTDLVGADNRNEAPKLLRGYNLIKDNGCFGCHEIAGKKSGKQIGPDLRLEPNPPLEDLRPEDRAKIEGDPDNPPGNLLKVGPSLFRLAEKTNTDWTAKWLLSPRNFRPDTKMPHFYGLSNNDPKTLPADQKDFPNAEIQSIAHFLFKESKQFLKDVDDRAKDDPAARRKDQERVDALYVKGKWTEEEKKEVDEITARIKLRQVKPLIDLAPAGYAGDPIKGRLLFAERGCLACHSHEGSETDRGARGEKAKDDTLLFSPKIVSEANFGPNLSQVKEKLGLKPGDAAARKWLIQWLMDPKVHSPRTRMPVTHLDPREAADLAAWLLGHKAQDLGPDWPDLEVTEPELKTLQSLANVYLVRMLPKSGMGQFAEGTLDPGARNELPADEKALHGKFQNPDDLKYYLGKKAVSRLGCYACHDIPGFENAKPIGVGLNDWGKKDAERLAFEDIHHYFADHYYPVNKLVNKEGKPHGLNKDGKEPYEKYYADQLHGHFRDGYLNQKVREPRSYDHNRMRAWDDRLRMPQFRLARSRQHKGELKDEYDARSMNEEAEAREAVATFILGLTSEQVPTVSINQPKGDRLAEVNGRQVLDKYNCGGCHLIRPGIYDFQVNPEMTERLTERFDKSRKRPGVSAEHNFPEHAYWTGRNPGSEKLTAYGVFPALQKDDGDEEEKDAPYKQFRLQLSYALRFEGPDKSMRDIWASNNLTVPLKDMVYPPPGVSDPRELAAFMKDRGPYGGAYQELLVKYLMAKDPELYKDNGIAGSAAPPSLIGQGERTQPQWLFKFLLDPHPMRKMTVLRMPKFNMSREEAQTLVDYFAAVERTMNPRAAPTTAFAQLPQQDDLDSPYWTKLNKDYVVQLRNSWPMVKDKDGKVSKVGANSWYDKRIEELTPLWAQVHKENQEQHQSAVSRLKAVTEQADKAKELAKELAKKEADPQKKKALEDQVKALDDIRFAWETEAKNWGEKVADSVPEKQQVTWEQKEAYLTDAFRLLNNNQLCSLCHQVVPGQVVTNKIQGPPLYGAYDRLRPGWLERWIAVPSRHVPFISPMTLYFPADDNSQYQHLMAGSSLDRIRASRDVLLNYPRALSLPASRYLILPLPAEKEKTGDKK